MGLQLRTEQIDSPARLARLVPEWQELCARCQNATPFQRPEWLVPWCMILLPGELAVISVRRDDQLVAIAPLFASRNAGKTSLVPLGVPITDYADLLMDPNCAAGAWHALAAHLSMIEWSAIDLTDLPAGAAALALPCPPDCSETRERSTPCPYLAIADTGGDLGRLLPPRKRRSVRMAENRSARRGEICIESLRERSVEEMLADLFRLHALRWQSRGESGVLADNRIRLFHRRAATLLDRLGLLRCYSLRNGDERVAAYYGFLDGHTAYGYLTGFDPHYDYESPGTLIVAHAIAEASREGAREFHFLRGGERYKYQWGAHDRWNSRRVIKRTSHDG